MEGSPFALPPFEEPVQGGTRSDTALAHRKREELSQTRLLRFPQRGSARIASVFTEFAYNKALSTVGREDLLEARL